MWRECGRVRYFQLSRDCRWAAHSWILYIACGSIDEIVSARTFSILFKCDSILWWWIECKFVRSFVRLTRLRKYEFGTLFVRLLNFPIVKRPTAIQMPDTRIIRGNFGLGHWIIESHKFEKRNIQRLSNRATRKMHTMTMRRVSNWPPIKSWAISHWNGRPTDRIAHYLWWVQLIRPFFGRKPNVTESREKQTMVINFVVM